MKSLSGWDAARLNRVRREVLQWWQVVDLTRTLSCSRMKIAVPPPARREQLHQRSLPRQATPVRCVSSSFPPHTHTRCCLRSLPHYAEEVVHRYQGAGTTAGEDLLSCIIRIATAFQSGKRLFLAWWKLLWITSANDRGWHPTRYRRCQLPIHQRRSDMAPAKRRRRSHISGFLR